MTRPIPLTTLALALALAAGGCGAGATHTTTGDAKSTTAASRPATPTVLEASVRQAVEQDHELLVAALQTNRVPANPQGTAGPALVNIRQSVAQRQKQGVTVRMLSDKFRVLSVQLDPSYTTATATVLDVQRVQPSYDHGHTRGKVSAFHDRARLELHRVGDTLRFVVWKVALL